MGRQSRRRAEKHKQDAKHLANALKKVGSAEKLAEMLAQNYQRGHEKQEAYRAANPARYKDNACAGIPQPEVPIHTPHATYPVEG
jgi:hypothetical protein